MALTPSKLFVDSTVSLTKAAAGCDLQVESVGGPDCSQLRDLGFCEQMRVRKIANGRNLICTVCGSRLAISSHLADHIQVKQLS
ncbi:MAG: ferrous iron transport protein A [Verrucomicrobiota bacterium JB023]|nr:ferrous iron transport protein A [Verrucomicrobiota bacterium JB023]